MSILNRFATSQHLDDRALAELWCNLDGRTDSPSQDAHLTHCPQCRSRFAAFGAWLDDMKLEARAEADEAFPPERLATQQSQILRRLEAMERPARVIAFPSQSRPATATRRGPQRWIAAAAAAGLVVGLVAGQLVDLKRSLYGTGTVEPISQNAGGRSTSVARGPIQPVTAIGTGEESLLYDTATTPRTIQELSHLDALTPRMRDLEVAR